MTPDDWRLVFEGVVAVIAVLGFVLGLVNLAFTWWTYQPQVKVSMTTAVVVGPGGAGPMMLLISARNTGRVPVTLSSVGLGGQAPQHALAGSSRPLPDTLAPIVRTTYWTDELARR